MSSTRTILVIHYSPTPTVRSVADIVLGAVRSAVQEINNDADLDVTVEVVERNPLEFTWGLPASAAAQATAAQAGDSQGGGSQGGESQVGGGQPSDSQAAAQDPATILAEELIAADAVIFGTPANFGYISGALKHYFDATFVAAHEKTKGKPVSWWIRGGYDTTGAQKAMRSLTTGFDMEIAAQPVEFCGDVEPQRQALEDMGQAIVGALLRA